MAEATKVTNEDVIEIDLQELIGLLLQKFWLLAICGLAGGILAFCISFFLIVPKYESSTSVYILNKNDNNTVTYSDVQLGTQLTKDYAQLITSRHVLESVIETCQLADSYTSLYNRVNVKAISDTRLIEITVTDVDPVMAQMIANEIRKVAANRIMEVMDIQAVNVVDEANLPQKPVSPSVPKWTAIGFLMGAVLCAMIVVIRFLLDDTIKTADDIEKYLELSTLAVIPVIDQNDAKKNKGKSGKKKQNGNFAKYDLDEIDLDQEAGHSSEKTGEKPNDKPNDKFNDKNEIKTPEKGNEENHAEKEKETEHADH